VVKKQRGMRTSLRAASQVQERDLREVAERIIEDPGSVLPECRGHRSHFKGASKAIAKVWQFRDDPARLAILTKRGHPFGRAVAATLLAAQTDEQLIMLQMPTPWGKVPVASRGTAKGVHLLGIQQMADRKLRLFLILAIAKKKRLRFYSLAQGGIVCVGKRGEPPPEFVQGEAQALGLIASPGGWGCAHAVTAPEKLAVRWAAARTAFATCGACARDRNTLHTIVEHIAAPDVLDGFEVEVDLAPLPTQGSEPVPLPPKTDLDAAALEKYRKGTLDDAGLLAAQKEARLAQLRSRAGVLLVNSGVNHGADIASFTASLNPTPAESTALRAALEGWDKPIVQERGTPAKVLADLWKERGIAALEALSGDRGIAEQIHASHDVASKGVGPALQQAQARGSRQATDSALPTYAHLPPAAKLADKVARAHRAHGAKAALATLEQEGVDARLKGLAHALELALGSGQGSAWKYSPLELDVARTLQPLAATLLRAEPARYHDALQALARAAGVTEDLRRG
jgi:hypothetical protein